MPDAPWRLVQLTDFHLLADADGRLHGVNTFAALAAVVERLCAEPPPDAVLATGDLSEDGSAESYRFAKSLLGRIGAPVHCVAGNHDRRETLTAVMPGPGVHVERTSRRGHWQVVFLDSTVDGANDGRLGDDELAALDRVLGERSDLHALVCLHHQPVAVGGAWGDVVSLENPQALFAVLDRHPQVRGVVWGHVHQSFDDTRRGVRLMGTPATAFQFAHAGQGPIAVADESPAYRRLTLHADGTIETEVCWLDGALRPGHSPTAKPRPTGEAR